MKKIIAGLGFLFAGILLYISACFAGCFNLQYTTEWRNSMGRFWQSVMDCGMMPAVAFGFVFLLLGSALMIWGVFEQNGSGRKRA